MASARRVVRQRFANRRAPPPPAPGFTLSSAHLTILASALVICVSLFNTVRGISRLEANVDAPITAGSITAGVVPSAAGTANPGVTITAGMIAVAEFAPYVAQVGSPSSPAYASAGYTVSAGLVGPSEAWMTVEFW